MNFAQSMGAKPGGDADTPLRSVQIDGQVRVRSIARAHRETRSRALRKDPPPRPRARERREAIAPPPPPSARVVPALLSHIVVVVVARVADA
jgi:hypothetical protein